MIKTTGRALVAFQSCGDPVTHRDCPRCWKVVKVKKDCGLAAHKDGYRTCSQVPWERAS